MKRIQIIRFLIILFFTYLYNTENTIANDVSIQVGESKFKLIKEDYFSGRDLFELAIHAGIYKRKDNEYLPGAERGAFSAGGRTWHGSNGVGLVAYDPHMKKYSIYYLQNQAVLGHHLDIVYADKDYIFFSYGYHRDLTGVQPNLEVYSLKQRRFARIISISIKGAKLGRFSMEKFESSKPGSIPPEISWNDQRFLGKQTINLFDAGLTRPESFILQDGSFELRFHESWGVDEFVTVLKFSKVDLSQELDKLFSDKPE